MQCAGVAYVEAEQLRQRQVDLAYLVDVELVAETAHAGHLRRGQRLVRVLGQRRPGGAVQLDVRGRGHGDHLLSTPWLLLTPRAVRRQWFEATRVKRMCGIVGYVGARRAQDIVIDGLRRLEYRGYDSAGIALLEPGGVRVAKRAGKLANLDKALAEEPLPPGTTGIGHTRWATHGPPTDRNAHPHLDCGERVAVIHNGIIENFAALRAGLEERGHELSSDTDTEAVAHLLEERLAEGADIGDALRAVCQLLEGAFTLVVVDAEQSDVVAAARRSSPLVVGRGKGENFVASDVTAFIEHTREAIELGQDQVVVLTEDEIGVTDFEGRPATTSDYHVDWDAAAAEKGGYEWFMLKEIDEQPEAVANTLLGRHASDGSLQLDEMRLSDDELRQIDKVIIIACGTAFYAGLVAKYAIEHWTRL